MKIFGALLCVYTRVNRVFCYILLLLSLSSFSLMKHLACVFTEWFSLKEQWKRKSEKKSSWMQMLVWTCRKFLFCIEKPCTFYCESPTLELNSHIAKLLTSNNINSEFILYSAHAIQASNAPRFMHIHRHYRYIFFIYFFEIIWMLQFSDVRKHKKCKTLCLIHIIASTTSDASWLFSSLIVAFLYSVR